MTQESSSSFSIKVARYLSVGFPIVCVLTHEETRAVEYVRNLVKSLPLHIWSVTDGLAGNTTLREPLAAVRHATVSNDAGVYVFLDLHPYFGDPALVRALRDFATHASKVRKACVLVMPHADIPTEIEKDVAIVDLPLPTEQELTALFEAELEQWQASRSSAGNHAPATMPRDLEPDKMVRAVRGLTASEAQRAYRLAFRAQNAEDAFRQLVEEKRRVLRRSAALELVEPDVGLEAVGGLEVLKGWLRARVPAFGRQARKFGLPEPRGMLICGVQGCGKSLVAKAASVVFGLPLVRLDFAAVFSAASPELSLRQAMRITEAIAPVVLWVDEIEKGLAGGVADASHARIFGDFLIWLQEKKAPVFVAATANDVDLLPPELTRRGRFDDIFFVDLPAAKEREEILAIHLQHRNRDPQGFPLEALVKALDGFSGAELEQAVIAGLFRAFASQRELGPQDLQVSLQEIIPLATMYEEKVAALRTWAKARARRASADRRTLELFED